MGPLPHHAAIGGYTASCYNPLAEYQPISYYGKVFNKLQINSQALFVNCIIHQVLTTGGHSCQSRTKGRGSGISRPQIATGDFCILSVDYWNQISPNDDFALPWFGGRADADSCITIMQ